MATTKQALAFLTDIHNELTAFLAGVGLLDNQTAINELETKFNTALTAFLAEYEALLGGMATASSQVDSLSEKIDLLEEYYRIENERLMALRSEKEDLVREIDFLEEQKASIEQIAQGQREGIEAKIEEIEQDITDTEAELESLRQNPDAHAQQIKALEKELNGHLIRLQLQKEVLALSGLDTAQQVATVELQIEQQGEDVKELEEEEIIGQEEIVNQLNQQLETLQTELVPLTEAETLAQSNLAGFESDYQYLLTEDVTEFLDGGVTEDSPEAVQLWQQIVAVEVQEVIAERLVSLESQDTTEQVIEVAIGRDSIEGYVVLEGQIATEIQVLNDIWLGNLEESNQFTVDVFNLSQERNEAVDNLVTYIEENLAESEGEYVLDKIGYEEALALQEAQVKYRDGLALAVDSLTEAVEVFELRVE
ncbi:MAG: hypothetical protein AB4058_00845 [Microcystaceae cyanobacterium]